MKKLLVLGMVFVPLIVPAAASAHTPPPSVAKRVAVKEFKDRCNGWVESGQLKHCNTPVLRRTGSSAHTISFAGRMTGSDGDGGRWTWVLSAEVGWLDDNYRNRLAVHVHDMHCTKCGKV